MSRLLLSISIVILMAASAAAQTTRPIPAGWTKAVTDFSAAINSGDEEATQTFLAPQAEIRTFSPSAIASLKSLLEFSTPTTPLGVHAYFHPPLTMAADLATDVAASTVVPPEAKAALTIDAQNAVSAAADTAVKWAARVLEAKDGTLIGTISLWSARDNTGATSTHPVFILVRGTQNEAGKFVISKVVFGDPLQ